MIRRFFLGVTLIAVLFTGFISSANTAQAAEQLPQLYVRGVTLDKTSFNAGDTVSGTAILENAGSVSVPDATYAVRVVGGYTEDNLPGATYAEDINGPLFLAPGERTEVAFQITIPEFVSGNDVGIEVQIGLADGFFMGWRDVRVTVKGSELLIPVTDPYVFVGGSGYALQEGPTFSDPEVPQLRFTAENTSDESVTLTPKFSYYDSVGDTGSANEKTGASFIVPAKGTYDAAFDLETFGYRSGVKNGTMILVDQSGRQRSAEIDFRYIVGGDILNIQSVSSEKESASRGDEIPVTIFFTGIPFDITDPEANNSLGAGTITVTLFNEHDQMVATRQIPVNLDTDTSASATLTATRAAAALRAEVEISKFDAVLASANVNLSPKYDELHAQLPMLPWVYIIGGIVLAVLIILVVIWLTKKKRLPPVAPGVAALALVVLGAAGGFFLGGESPVADAANYNYLYGYIDAPGYVTTEQPWLAWKTEQRIARNTQLPALFINAPIDELEPGDTFYVQGLMKSLYCYNTPQIAGVDVLYEGTRVKKRYTGGCAARECNNEKVSGFSGKAQLITDRFSVGPFTVPQNPADNKLWVGVGWASTWETGRAGNGIWGYMDISSLIQKPDLTAGTPAFTPAEAQNGTSVTFSAVINNITSGLANGPFNNIFQIDIGNNGSWDTDLQSTTVVSSLAGGGSQTIVSPSWTAQTGTYAVRVCADTPGNVVDEENENNNCSSAPYVFQIPSVPSCRDGIDNDGNGLIDYPADPGCSSADDANESTPAQCADGIDNDNDGLIDLADSDCDSSADNSEASSGQAALTLTASASIVQPEQTVTLTWSAQNIEADSCTLSGDNGDSWTLSGTGGTKVSNQLLNETTFTLNCTDGNGDPVSISATVLVAPSFDEI